MLENKKFYGTTSTGQLPKIEIDGNIIKGSANEYSQEPLSEVIGSYVASKFLPAVRYSLDYAKSYPQIDWPGEYVSVCKKLDIPLLQFAKAAEPLLGGKTKEIDILNIYSDLGLSKDYFVRMLIVDFIIGNTDRHWNNLDVTIKNGRYANVPLLDFGCSLLYNTSEYALDIDVDLPVHYFPSKMINRDFTKAIPEIINYWKLKVDIPYPVFTADEFAELLPDEAVRECEYRVSKLVEFVNKRVSALRGLI